MFGMQECNIGTRKNAEIIWSETWKTTEFENTGMKSLGRLDSFGFIGKYETFANAN